MTFRSYSLVRGALYGVLSGVLFHIVHIGRLARMSVLDTEVDGSNPGSSMLFP